MANKLGFNSEPVLWVEAVRALIVVGIAFGLTVTEEQLGLIMIALGSIAAVFTRSQVSPS